VVAEAVGVAEMELRDPRARRGQQAPLDPLGLRARLENRDRRESKGRLAQLVHKAHRGRKGRKAKLV